MSCYSFLLNRRCTVCVETRGLLPVPAAADADALNDVQAKPYVSNNDTYDLNAVLAALFLGVLILILFFVVSLILLLK